MSPDGEGTCTSGSAKEACPVSLILNRSLLQSDSLVARVTNDESNIVISSELYASNNIIGFRNLYGVCNVVAELARSRSRGKGVAALVGKVVLHDGR